MISTNFHHRRLIRLIRRNQGGQALVELALTMPLLILLLGGAVELGMATYAAIEVSNAARAAVQYAAMNGGANIYSTSGTLPTLDVTGMQNAANLDGANFISTSVACSNGATQPVCITSTSVACSCSNGVGTSTCTPGDCPNAQIEETISVKTQVTFNPGPHVAGMTSSFTLKGYAQEMVLQ